MPEKIRPSSPEFADIDAHMYLLNILANPHLWFGMTDQLKGMPQLERDVAYQELLQIIQGIIDE